MMIYISQRQTAIGLNVQQQATRRQTLALMADSKQQADSKRQGRTTRRPYIAEERQQKTTRDIEQPESRTMSNQPTVTRIDSKQREQGSPERRSPNCNK